MIVLLLYLCEKLRVKQHFIIIFFQIVRKNQGFRQYFKGLFDAYTFTIQVD
jgi:hypothetical protein